MICLNVGLSLKEGKRRGKYVKNLQESVNQKIGRRKSFSDAA